MRTDPKSSFVLILEDDVTPCYGVPSDEEFVQNEWKHLWPILCARVAAALHLKADMVYIGRHAFGGDVYVLIKAQCILTMTFVLLIEKLSILV